MKLKKTVYRYRYDERTHIWSVIELLNVLVSGSVDSYNLSDTLNRDARVVLRVLGDDEADVSPQDIITFAQAKNGIPNDNDKLVVVAVSKNSNGTKRVHHTKILCK